MKKLLYIFFILLLAGKLLGQDIEYSKTVIEKLCEPEMDGRGYYHAGDKKAAYYIEGEFEKMGLRAFDTMTDKNGSIRKKYTQYFHMKANTFPDEISLKFNDKIQMIAGVDYMVAPYSGEMHLREMNLVFLTKDDIKNEKKFDDFVYKDYIGSAMVIDKEIFDKYKENEFYIRVLKNEMKADLLLFLDPTKKLSWGFSEHFDKFPTIFMLKSKLPDKAKKIEVKIDEKIIYDYESQNVAGWVKGLKYPDSFIVIGAHYDHLGRMGKNVYFPGANDNASGTAMMLDLAKYYSSPENMPDYSIVFLAFGGEEAGLLGSKYYTEHPYFPLNKIRIMINLDLMGTGDKGMTIVNGTEFPKEYDSIVSINNKKKYLKEIQKRGPASISDHYYFFNNGVKALYFYLMGDYPFYHDPGDSPEKLSLAGYDGCFKLITEFLGQVQGKKSE